VPLGSGKARQEQRLVVFRQSNGFAVVDLDGKLVVGLAPLCRATRHEMVLPRRIRWQRGHADLAVGLPSMRGKCWEDGRSHQAQEDRVCSHRFLSAQRSG